MTELNGLTMTELDTETRPVEQYTEPGDHEKLAHYYDTRRFSLIDAMFNATPIEALCGKQWIPTRDPKKFPICPECQAIVDSRSRD